MGGFKLTEGVSSAQTAVFGSKRCPRCGEELFGDMGVCYGCLYDFGRDRRGELAAAGIPEEFVAVEEPGIEEVDLEEPDFEPPADLPQTCEGLGEGLPPALTAAPDGQDMICALRVWLRTDSADLLLPITAKGLVLGTDPSCDVVLHSAAASARHLRLVPARDGVLAFDLVADCPATCGGVPVGDGTLLAVGESVVVCGSVITVVGQEAGDGEA